MKMRFAMLDLNDDGLHNNVDVSIAAKRFAAYQNEGEEAEKVTLKFFKLSHYLMIKGLLKKNLYRK